jgi:ribonuclease HI
MCATTCNDDSAAEISQVLSRILVYWSWVSLGTGHFRNSPCGFSAQPRLRRTGWSLKVLPLSQDFRVDRGIDQTALKIG